MCEVTNGCHDVLNLPRYRLLLGRNCLALITRLRLSLCGRSRHEPQMGVESLDQFLSRALGLQIGTQSRDEMFLKQRGKYGLLVGAGLTLTVVPQP